MLIEIPPGVAEYLAEPQPLQTSSRSEQTRRTLRWIFGLLTVALTLGPLWWWALYGMSAEVGTAWMATAMFSGFGCFTTVVPDL